MTEAPKFGFSDCMGERLREFVERELILDLNIYLPEADRLHLADARFDWSESCVEGHRAIYLDGEIENFSGIAVYDPEGDLVAEGWMDFIECQDTFKIFWLFLHPGESYQLLQEPSGRVPAHVSNTLDEENKTLWREHAPKRKPS